MSEKDVWVKRRREEDVVEEGGEEEKGILGCAAVRCCHVWPCLHDKRYSTRKVSHWLKASELRHATNNAASRAGETPMFSSATNRLFRMQAGS